MEKKLCENLFSCILDSIKKRIEDDDQTSQMSSDLGDSVQGRSRSPSTSERTESRKRGRPSKKEIAERLRVMSPESRIAHSRRKEVRRGRSRGRSAEEYQKFPVTSKSHRGRGRPRGSGSLQRLSREAIAKTTSEKAVSPVKDIEIAGDDSALNTSHDSLVVETVDESLAMDFCDDDMAFVQTLDSSDGQQASIEDNKKPKEEWTVEVVACKKDIARATKPIMENDCLLLCLEDIRVSPLSSSKPEGIAPLASSKPVEMASLASSKPEEMVVLASSKQEDMAPMASSKPEDIAPLASSKPEDMAPMASSKPEEMVPLASAKPEDMASSKQEDMAVLTSSKPEDMTPLSSSKEEEMPPLTSSKQEDMAPLSSSMHADMAPLASSKQENMAPLSSSKQEDMAPSTSSKQENMAPSTSSKQEDKEELPVESQWKTEGKHGGFVFTEGKRDDVLYPVK